MRKTPFLMLTNHNKTLFIILTNPNKVLCVKIKQKSENPVKACVRNRPNIFSNIQLINKKVGSDIDGDMKEQF